MCICHMPPFTDVQLKQQGTRHSQAQTQKVFLVAGTVLKRRVFADNIVESIEIGSSTGFSVM